MYHINMHINITNMSCSTGTGVLDGKNIEQCVEDIKNNFFLIYRVCFYDNGYSKLCICN